jgi:hypothetical protein
MTIAAMAVCALGHEAASEAKGGAVCGAAGGTGSEGGVRARGRSEGDGRMAVRRVVRGVRRTTSMTSEAGFSVSRGTDECGRGTVRGICTGSARATAAGHRGFVCTVAVQGLQSAVHGLQSARSSWSAPATCSSSFVSRGSTEPKR